MPTQAERFRGMSIAGWPVAAPGARGHREGLGESGRASAVAWERWEERNEHYPGVRRPGKGEDPHRVPVSASTACDWPDGGAGPGRRRPAVAVPASWRPEPAASAAGGF